MAKNRNTFAKRARETDKKRKADDKKTKRTERKEQGDDGPQEPKYATLDEDGNPIMERS